MSDHDPFCICTDPTWSEVYCTCDVLIRIGREINEIIYAAPLLRLHDDDGPRRWWRRTRQLRIALSTEWVARDDLARAVRDHILRRNATDPRPGPLPPLAAAPPAAAPGLPGRAGTSPHDEERARILAVLDGMWRDDASVYSHAARLVIADLRAAIEASDE